MNLPSNTVLQSGKYQIIGTLGQGGFGNTFYIDKFEVSREIWDAIMLSSNSSHSDLEKGKLPIAQVSWAECNDFIKKLNYLTGLKFKLPSENEWEYAAVSGEDYKLKFEENPLASNSYSWSAANSGNQAHAIGKLSPNKLGIYDMMGNVWEWTSTPFSKQTSETGDSIYVRKGGSFKTSSIESILGRYGDYENHKIHHLGFRLALQKP